MFEIVPHTADVRVRVESSTLEGLFDDAGRALVSISEVEFDPEEMTTRQLQVESTDRTGLLIDFLNELLALLHVERVAFVAFDFAKIEATKLRAVARFRRATNWGEDIKAATYHEADIRLDGELWSTTIVLDI